MSSLALAAAPFLAFGLLARFNAVVAIGIGDGSVGGAMVPVLDVNRPCGGIMPVSAGSMRAAIGLMGT